jgi:hypothetical protein
MKLARKIRASGMSTSSLGPGKLGVVSCCYRDSKRECPINDASNIEGIVNEYVVHTEIRMGDGESI